VRDADDAKATAFGGDSEDDLFDWFQRLDLVRPRY
jgi:hypothetical protein